MINQLNIHELTGLKNALGLAAHVVGEQRPDIDHFILSPEGAFSFAEHGLIQYV